MREIRVPKVHKGEKGFDIIVPFYTHLNNKKEECGILVNQGWVPTDLVDLRRHKYGQYTAKIEGILYRGDALSKWSPQNTILGEEYYNVVPRDFAHLCQLGNKDEASQFMLMQLDPNPNARDILPSKPTKEDFEHFRITPERHAAYSAFWYYATLMGVAGNTFMWLYW